jgi:hypothetical protein
MQSFLEGPKAALVASKDFDNGHYKTTPQHGIRAFGRVYSAWAYGQTVSKFFFVTLFCLIPSLQWYREHQYLFSGQCVRSLLLHLP